MPTRIRSSDSLMEYYQNDVGASAKMQDAERGIAEDELFYQRTGKNMSYDDFQRSPLVDDDEMASQSPGQLAKVERQEKADREIAMIELARIRAEEKRLEKELQDKFRDAMSYLEV